MFKRWQQMPRHIQERAREAALTHPRAHPAIRYEPWYLHRFHFLPEGYLSDRGTRLYERVIHPLYHHGQAARAMAYAAALLRTAGARRVLDLGCGPGDGLVRLRAAGFDAAGIDLSPHMVARAAERAGAPVHHGDGRALPFPDRELDGVVASHVLGHVPAGIAAELAREAVRVLRIGGRLITVEHSWHEVAVPGLRRLAERRLAGGLQVVTAYVRDAI